jgi:hypothetical protein
MTEHGEEINQHIAPEKAEKKNFAARFYDRWKRELARVGESLERADEEARLKLQTLNADVLRRAGLRESAYGVALTSLHAATAGLGATIGGLAGAIGGAAAGGVIGGVGGAVITSELGPGMVAGAGAGAWFGLIGGGMAGSVGGSILGYQAGVELAGFVYQKFVRKLDTDLLPLTKFDWILGQVPGLNPPIVGGIRTMLEGFFGLAAKTEEAAAKPAIR